MKIINEIGNKYNNLQVIDEAPSKNGRKYWKCQCIFCKKIYEISGTQLRKGNQKCSQCFHIGEKFGKLTIIDFDYTAPDRHQYWKCKCECGNIETVRYSTLKAGEKKMCFNCFKQEHRQYKEETGNKYGKLTVLEYDKTSGKNAKWICKCDCGNIVSVLGIKLRFGHTTSCGCIKSKGEEKIIKILIDNNIPFKTQVSFDSCKNISLLKFDFGVYDGNDSIKYLIEYDGQQHFKSGNGWNTKENVKKIQKNDNIKNKWCKENNIPLIRIPYTKFETLNIKDLLIESSDFLWENVKEEKQN